MPSSNITHCVLLDGSGTCYFCLGQNEKGQLGTGRQTARDKFTLVNLPTKLSQLSAGLDFTVGVAEDGSLWGWGSNHCGQLGIGHGQGNSICTPTLIPDTFNFVQISAGRYFTIALDSFGRVWSFGLNSQGELGLGDFDNRDIPTLIDTLSNICFVSAGNAHTIVLDLDGNVWSFGNNKNGQLGIASQENSLSLPCKIDSVGSIIKVSAGFSHNLLVDTFGKVWSFGLNRNGQLGLGDSESRNAPQMIVTLENVSDVQCGGSSSIVVDVHERVYVFGFTVFGQLGHNPSGIEAIFAPQEQMEWTHRSIIRGAHHTVVVEPDGTVSFFGATFGVELNVDSSPKIVLQPKTRMTQMKSANKCEN